MAEAWRTAELTCHALGTSARSHTTACRWFGQAPRSPVLELRTSSGDTIRATADHPFWTPDGMKPLGELKPGDRVARSPFEGVPFEEPGDEVIISEEEFRATLPRFGIADAGTEQVVCYLKERGLLPLRYSSPATPVLAKLAGFVFGDGNLHFDKQGKGVVSFHGKAEDLEDIRADIASLGVTPSKVYRRQRTHTITTTYKTYTFDRTEEWFKVVGRSFAALLACLGVPVGVKAKQDYNLPVWLDSAPLWHKRLFLAAHFGAELSKPATVPNHDTVFASPVLSLSKRTATVASGERMLDRLAAWLGEFGVTVQKHGRRYEQLNPDGDRSVRLRLVIANDSQNLIRLWSRIGFEYNRERANLAAVAVQYLKEKEELIARRYSVAEQAVALAAAGTPRQDIFDKLVGTDANSRFVERSLYERRKGRPRVGEGFTRFADFCIQRCVGTGGMVWDVHRVHHSGSGLQRAGVRLHCQPRGSQLRCQWLRRLQLRRAAGEDEPVSRRREAPHPRAGEGAVLHHPVRGRAHRAVQVRQHRDAPAHGRGAAVRHRPRSRRAARPGTHRGQRPHPRRRPASRFPTTPSSAAREQCGTLGSGNHFLEVQVVDAVFDADVAKAFGLELNQVCVMIHSGSRGLGYQVCDDALAVFRNCPAKYGIDLPDRQLACAPVDTPEGRKYIAAMRAAANYGFCNRQLLMQQAREVFAARVRPLVGRPRHGTALRRGSQHRQARRAHRRRQEEEGLGSPQGGDAGLPRRASGGAGGVPRRGPAGHHPRRHGPGVVGARRQRRQHGEDASARPATGPGRAMSRTAAKLDGAGPQDRQGTGAPRRDRDGRQPQRPRGGAAEGVQERGRRGRCRPRRPTCRARSPACGRSA